MNLPVCWKKATVLNLYSAAPDFLFVSYQVKIYPTLSNYSYNVPMMFNHVCLLGDEINDKSIPICCKHDIPIKTRDTLNGKSLD